MRTRLALAAILLLGLGLRGWYLSHLEPYPRFERIRNALDDQMFLDDWAKRALDGRPLDLAMSRHEFAYWAARDPGVYPSAPLYPWFLAATYAVAGVRYDAVRILQIGAGLLTLLLLYRIGGRIFSRAAGLAAALLGALYAPWIYYESTFLRTTLLVLASALALERLLAAAAPEATWRTALAAGLVLGASVVLQEQLLLFALAGIAWLLWTRRHETPASATPAVPVRARSRIGIWGVAGLLLPILPVVATNAIRSGHFAFISSTAAFNLFIGNVHDSPGTVPTTTPAYEEVKARSESASVSLVGELVRDAWSHPLDTVRLFGRKLVALARPVEYPNNESYALARRLNSLPAPLERCWLLPLAVLGAALASRAGAIQSSGGAIRSSDGAIESRGGASQSMRRLLWIFFLCAAVSILAFVVISRLVQPLVVPLLLWAGNGVAVWTGWLRERRWAIASGTAIAVLLAGIALRPDESRFVRATDYQMAGAAYATEAALALERGDSPVAWRAAARAVSLNPAHAQAVALLARLPAPAPGASPSALEESDRKCAEGEKRAAAGDLAAAETELREAMALAPGAAKPWHFLANVRFLEHDHEGAALALEEAVRRQPLDPGLRNNLAALRGLAP